MCLNVYIANQYELLFYFVQAIIEILSTYKLTLKSERPKTPENIMKKKKLYIYIYIDLSGENGNFNRNETLSNDFHLL